MTAKEIRAYDLRSLVDPRDIGIIALHRQMSDLEWWLREIAAQLAEVNERERLREAMK